MSLTRKLLFLSGKQSGLVSDQAWWQILCAVRQLWRPSSPRYFLVPLLFPHLQCQTVVLQMTMCHPVEPGHRWRNTFQIPCHHQRSLHKTYSTWNYSHPRVNPKRAKSKTVTRVNGLIRGLKYYHLREVRISLFFINYHTNFLAPIFKGSRHLWLFLISL